MKLKTIGDDLIKLELFINNNSHRFMSKETTDLIKERLETLISKAQEL